MPSALMPAPSSQTSLPGLCSLGRHCWTPDGSVPSPSSRKLLLSSFFNRSSWSKVWLPSLVPLLSLLPQGTRELPGERPGLLIKFTPSRGLEPLCSVPAYVVSPLVWAPLENTPTTATRPYMCGSQLWLDLPTGPVLWTFFRGYKLLFRAPEALWGTLWLSPKLGLWPKRFPFKQGLPVGSLLEMKILLLPGQSLPGPGLSLSSSLGDFCSLLGSALVCCYWSPL